jgi:hypothetical protein
MSEKRQGLNILSILPMFHCTEACMPYLLGGALGRLPPARASLLTGVFLVPRPPLLPAQRPQLDRVVKRAAHKLHAQKPHYKNKIKPRLRKGDPKNCL